MQKRADRWKVSTLLSSSAIKERRPSNDEPTTASHQNEKATARQDQARQSSAGDGAGDGGCNILAVRENSVRWFLPAARLSDVTQDRVATPSTRTVQALWSPSQSPIYPHTAAHAFGGRSSVEPFPDSAAIFQKPAA
jgi:hypothetical protein